MSTEKKQSLYILVKEDRSHGYYRLVASIVTDSREVNPSERGRFPYGPHDPYNGPLYSGLGATAQGDERSRLSPARESAVYGFGRLTYGERYSTELGEAERIVKTIKTLERKLAKLAEVRGYARTFPEYVGRLAEVVGGHGIVIERSPKSRDVTGEQFEWLTVGDGITRLANWIYQWQREAMGEAISA